MILRNVDRVDSISHEDFQERYVKPCKPLVIKSLTKNWAARTKWTYDYFKSLAGDKIVPVYDNSIPTADSAVNKPDGEMKFSEYLDRIASGPTELRIFLFNIFDHIPSLTEDFTYFDNLCGGFLKKYPMMFFGGAGSKVFLHFDMDMSHVFITQFKGRKRVILFDNSYSDALYKMPFMVQSYIDPEKPDFEKYPALRNVSGYETILEDGETLFMPSGIWHYMNYLEGGFALSLRSMETPVATKIKGLYNLFVMRKIDDFMKSNFTRKWYTYKNETALRRGNSVTA
ncbi:MAG TPA: cupin-like domain-containing protein [Cyclobacteriaceae bacterium]|nr:cupin-like domain-containing protein [Cyclobacteriaceae bacterium]